jgi:pyrimidine deaminase RibD-like protein
MAIVVDQDKAVGFEVRFVVGSTHTEVDAAHHYRLPVSHDRLHDGRVDDSDEGFPSEAE